MSNREHSPLPKGVGAPASPRNTRRSRLSSEVAEPVPRLTRTRSGSGSVKRVTSYNETYLADIQAKNKGKKSSIPPPVRPKPGQGKPATSVNPEAGIEEVVPRGQPKASAQKDKKQEEQPTRVESTPKIFTTEPRNVANFSGSESQPTGPLNVANISGHSFISVRKGSTYIDPASGSKEEFHQSETGKKIDPVISDKIIDETYSISDKSENNTITGKAAAGPVVGKPTSAPMSPSPRENSAAGEILTPLGSQDPEKSLLNTEDINKFKQASITALNAGVQNINPLEMNVVNKKVPLNVNMPVINVTSASSSNGPQPQQGPEVHPEVHHRAEDQDQPEVEPQPLPSQTASIVNDLVVDKNVAPAKFPPLGSTASLPLVGTPADGADLGLPADEGIKAATLDDLNLLKPEGFYSKCSEWRASPNMPSPTSSNEMFQTANSKFNLQASKLDNLSKFPKGMEYDQVKSETKLAEDEEESLIQQYIDECVAQIHGWPLDMNNLLVFSPEEVYFKLSEFTDACAEILSYYAKLNLMFKAVITMSADHSEWEAEYKLDDSVVKVIRHDTMQVYRNITNIHRFFRKMNQDQLQIEVSKAQVMVINVQKNLLLESIEQYSFEKGVKLGKLDDASSLHTALTMALSMRSRDLVGKDNAQQFRHANTVQAARLCHIEVGLHLGEVDYEEYSGYAQKLEKMWEVLLQEYFDVNYRRVEKANALAQIEAEAKRQKAAQDQAELEAKLQAQAQEAKAKEKAEKEAAAKAKAEALRAEDLMKKDFESKRNEQYDLGQKTPLPPSGGTSGELESPSKANEERFAKETPKMEPVMNILNNLGGTYVKNAQRRLPQFNASAWRGSYVPKPTVTARDIIGAQNILDGLNRPPRSNCSTPKNREVPDMHADVSGIVGASGGMPARQTPPTQDKPVHQQPQQPRQNDPPQERDQSARDSQVVGEPSRGHEGDPPDDPSGGSSSSSEVSDISRSSSHKKKIKKKKSKKSKDKKPKVAFNDDVLKQLSDNVSRFIAATHEGITANQTTMANMTTTGGRSTTPAALNDSCFESYEDRDKFQETLPVPWNVKITSRARASDEMTMARTTFPESVKFDGKGYIEWRAIANTHINQTNLPIASKIALIRSAVKWKDCTLLTIIVNTQDHTEVGYKKILQDLEKNYGGEHRALRYICQQLFESKRLDKNNKVSCIEIHARLVKFVQHCEQNGLASSLSSIDTVQKVCQIT